MHSQDEFLGMMTEITDLGLHDQHHLSLNVITPAIEAL
jgi:hypothetical protein